MTIGLRYPSLPVVLNPELAFHMPGPGAAGDDHGADRIRYRQWAMASSAVIFSAGDRMTLLGNRDAVAAGREAA